MCIYASKKNYHMCAARDATPRLFSVHSFLNFKLENSDFEIFAELERLHSAYAVRVRRFGVKFTIIVSLFGNSFNKFSGL